MIKKALILAGGRGRRLDDYTKDKPKCLIEIEGKCFLDYQLEALEKNNIKEVIIVIGDKGDKIKEFIQNPKFKNLDIKIVENKEFELTNSSYGVWLVRDEIKQEHYIHLNCDLIFSADLLKRVIESKHENVIVIDTKIELKDNMEQVYMDEDNKITHMQNTLLEGAVGKAVGVAKFSPKN